MTNLMAKEENSKILTRTHRLNKKKERARNQRADLTEIVHLQIREENQTCLRTLHMKKKMYLT
jgi:hypothetical protein